MERETNSPKKVVRGSVPVPGIGVQGPRPGAPGVPGKGTREGGVVLGEGGDWNLWCLSVTVMTFVVLNLSLSQL